MDKLPVISGKDLIKLLLKLRFVAARINGSHHRMRNEDGRVTTVPLHGNSDLPKGLLRKIIREDLKMSLVDFAEQVERHL